jgi:hypothetical protein
LASESIIRAGIILTSLCVLQGLVVELLQSFVEGNQIFVQSLGIHIEKLILSFVLSDHIKGEHHRSLSLRLMIGDIICLDNCDFIMIKNILDSLEFLGLIVAIGHRDPRLRFFFLVFAAN